MRLGARGSQLFRGAALWLALATLGWPAPARAEWKSFRSLDALVSDEITAAFCGRYGRVWIGTGWGLEWFDGSHWETILLRGRVNALHETSSGGVWAAIGSEGVRCVAFCGASYTTADGLADNTVHAILKDRSGALWFGTSLGLSRFDGQQWRTYRVADGLPADDVRAIAEDAAGVLWFGTSQGLARHDGTTWSVYRAADGLAGDYITTVLVAGDGALWVGTNAGVSRFDGSTWTSYTTLDGLPAGYLKVLLQDREGQLWVGARDALAYFDGRAWRTFGVADGMPGGWINGAAQDAYGGIWVGASIGGVSRFDVSSWKPIVDPAGLLNTSIRTIFQDRSGAYWFAGYSGLARWANGRWGLPPELQSEADRDALSLFEDRPGALWIGSWDRGVLRCDSTGVRRFTVADGLASNRVTSICEDDSGRVWCASAMDGVARFDGTTWARFTAADGLASNLVNDILADGTGALWFATSAGVSRLVGSGWTTFDFFDGLSSNVVNALLLDADGVLWAATAYGLSRYEAGTWTYLHYSSLGSGGSLYTDTFHSITQDAKGDLWLGSEDGLVRFDGTNWGRYGAEDGVGGTRVNFVLADASSDIWMAPEALVVRHMPERVPPKTVVARAPIVESASRSQTIVVGAGFAEIEGVSYSFSFDGAPWSYWSGAGLWTDDEIADGHHTLRIRARDRIGNEDPAPPEIRFEIDATPPVPSIRLPVFGQALRDSVSVLGRANDEKFGFYMLAARGLPNGAWFSLNPEYYVGAPVDDGVLGGWNTRNYPDGDYELVLEVHDRLGLMGTAMLRVVVDNEPPWAQQTTPAKISASGGGDVFTTNSEVHVYFPPDFFAEDATVTVAAVPDSAVQEAPAGVVRRAGPGYALAWSGATSPAGKSAVLDLGLADSLVSRAIALWDSVPGGGWERLGGTVDRERKRISAAITAPGVYELFEETAALVGEGGLSPLTLVPRVFSPQGSFANPEVAIGFTLSAAGPASVRIYNRAGRLVREVLSGQPLPSGANLVRWDGRDTDGQVAEDGLYIVAVEALGETQQQTLAIVR